jgi:AcrR family transcriptional regulator
MNIDFNNFRPIGVALALTPMVKGKKPGPYHHGDLRRALIEVALKLVSEKGIAGLTMREAGRLAGVSQAAPYRHFADKNALLLAVAGEGFRALHSQILESLGAAGPDVSSRLSAIGVGYVTFAIAHPSHFRIMFSQELTRGPADPSAEETAMAAFVELVGEIYRGQSTGVLRGEEPLGLALACWSIAHGLAGILIEGLLERGDLAATAPLGPEELTRMVTGLLITGLAKP